MVAKSLIRLLRNIEFAPHSGKGFLRMGAITITVAGLGGAGLHAMTPQSVSAQLVSHGTVLASSGSGLDHLSAVPHDFGLLHSSSSSDSPQAGSGVVPSSSVAPKASNGQSNSSPSRVPSTPTATPPPASTPQAPAIPSQGLQDPSANLPDSFYGTCATDNAASGPNSYGCQVAAIAAINQAHADEGIAPLQLPSNYYSLTPAEQLFVLVNEERVERGLTPAVGIATSLASDALGGSEGNADPSLGSPPGQIDGDSFYGTIGANWAADYSVSASVFDWMYADGWAGSATTNEACASAGAPGCWQHRANILASEPASLTVVMGTASEVEAPGSSYQGLESDAMIIASAPTSESLAYSYTWAQAVQAGA